MTRKAFCARLTGASVALLMHGCGGGGSDAAPAGAPVGAHPAGAGCIDAIAANHGHVLTIPAADLDSAVDKVYDIQGTAPHNHTVTLTVADLRSLKAGMTVTIISSTADEHQHSVSILCT